MKITNSKSKSTLSQIITFDETNTISHVNWVRFSQLERLSRKEEINNLPMKDRKATIKLGYFIYLLKCNEVLTDLKEDKESIAIMGESKGKGYYFNPTRGEKNNRVIYGFINPDDAEIYSMAAYPKIHHKLTRDKYRIILADKKRKKINQPKQREEVYSGVTDFEPD